MAAYDTFEDPGTEEMKAEVENGQPEMDDSKMQLRRRIAAARFELQQSQSTLSARRRGSSLTPAQALDDEDDAPVSPRKGIVGFAPSDSSIEEDLVRRIDDLRAELEESRDALNGRAPATPRGGGDDARPLTRAEVALRARRLKAEMGGGEGETPEERLAAAASRASRRLEDAAAAERSRRLLHERVSERRARLGALEGQLKALRTTRNSAAQPSGGADGGAPGVEPLPQRGPGGAGGGAPLGAEGGFAALLSLLRCGDCGLGLADADAGDEGDLVLSGETRIESAFDPNGGDRPVGQTEVALRQRLVADRVRSEQLDGGEASAEPRARPAPVPSFNDLEQRAAADDDDEGRYLPIHELGDGSSSR